MGARLYSKGVAIKIALIQAIGGGGFAKMTLFGSETTNKNINRNFAGLSHFWGGGILFVCFSPP